jgi:hypothetical protein
MFTEETDKDTLKIDIEPIRVQLLTEPYVVYSRFGYAPVINVWVKKNKREYMMYLSASSLGKGIEAVRKKNGSDFKGLEFWIRKESAEKKAKFIVED